MEGQEKRNNSGPVKGAAVRLFGFALISLWLLNSMFTLKAGLKTDPFNYLLFFSGAALLGLGILRSRQ